MVIAGLPASPAVGRRLPRPLLLVLTLVALALTFRLYLQGVQSTLRVPIAASAPMLVDLNRASADELMLLRGIGPARARTIVEDRRRRGPFRSVDDLQRVHGVGPATIAGLRGMVTVAEGVGASERR